MSNNWHEVELRAREHIEELHREADEYRQARIGKLPRANLLARFSALLRRSKNATEADSSTERHTKLA